MQTQLGQDHDWIVQLIADLKSLQSQTDDAAEQKQPARMRHASEAVCA